jgi:hypothetical protein
VTAPPAATRVASVKAYCQVCQGIGVVTLAAHYIETCELPTPVPVLCPHCTAGEPSFPIHHFHRRTP